MHPAPYGKLTTLTLKLRLPLCQRWISICYFVRKTEVVRFCLASFAVCQKQSSFLAHETSTHMKAAVKKKLLLFSQLFISVSTSIFGSPPATPEAKKVPKHCLQKLSIYQPSPTTLVIASYHKKLTAM